MPRALRLDAIELVRSFSLAPFGAFIWLSLASQHHTTIMRTVAESTQLSLPVDVRPEEVMRKQTLGAAIDLCMELVDKQEKELQADLGVDKGQFSRWKSGQEGIIWSKFVRLMDTCGNDAPLLWMLHQRGYDLYSLRKRETETERMLREAKEEIEQLKSEREIERRLFREIRSAA